MGKIRIKQIDEGLEEIKKPKKSQDSKKESVTPKKKSRVFEREDKPTHPRDVHGRSARYKAARKGIIEEVVAVKEAVEKIKKAATAKFVEAIELHINVEKSGMRIETKLPNPLSSKKKVLYITTEAAKAKKAAGNPEGVELTIKGDEAISEINSAGSAPNVDQIWAEASLMPRLASIAKIIGPVGLMPNPKHGTIVKPEDIGKNIKSLSEGSITLATEKKAAVMHIVVGKADMLSSKLTENVKAVMKAVGEKNIKTAYITSTMGPSVQIDPTTDQAIVG